MLFTKLSPVCVFYSSSHFYFLDLGQKNSSLEIMIYSFFKQDFFYFFQFYFLYFLREKIFFNKIERNKKINFTTFLAPMKIGIIVENRSCKKRTWMDFSLIHGFFLRSLIHWKS